MSGMWIFLTGDDGSNLWVNPDNITHVKARADGEKTYAEVWLTTGGALMVEEDYDTVVGKIQKATKTR
jgi:uncharacterized protein YlzI (FlbEa/FlbD family)